MRFVTIILLSVSSAACADMSGTSPPERVLSGSASIAGESDVASLQQYEEITGDLEIRAPGLASLELPRLRRVGENLWIYQNSALMDLSGLQNLIEVGGNIGIGNNDALESLHGLEGLDTAPGDLGVAHNPALTSLAALGRISSVGGMVGVTANAALTTLGLDGLTTVQNEISITDNTSLPTCRAQELVGQLVDFTGTLTLSGNDDAATCN
jgi:hypothetical protein